MFGYVRPLKPDLTVRDLGVFQSVYCGLCKTIGRLYGQIPRSHVTYDMTVLAVFLQALAPAVPEVARETCILNPIRKKPVRRPDLLLEYVAAATVLLAQAAHQDDAADDHPLRGRIGSLIFRGPARKAAARWPQLAAVIKHQLARLSEDEQRPGTPTAADAFGALLGDVFRQGCALIDSLAEPVREAGGLIGFELGRWVFLLDAIDDWQRDKDNKEWNPFEAAADIESARALGLPLLLDCEAALDRTAALMPYQRDATLIENILTRGLPDIRAKIWHAEPPGRF